MRPNVPLSHKTAPRQERYWEPISNMMCFLGSRLRYSAFGAWQVADHFNAEVVAGTIASKQDAIDYLTWTFFYRRLLQNPSYYNLESTEMEDVSEFLSDMVETTMATLQVCTFKRTMSFMPSFGSASSLEMLRIMPMTRSFFSSAERCAGGCRSFCWTLQPGGSQVKHKLRLTSAAGCCAANRCYMLQGGEQV